MKPSDIFTMIMIYFMVFFSNGDILYMVGLGAFTRIVYIRLLEEQEKPDGLFSVKPDSDPLEEPEEMRDGVKED